MKDKIYTIPVTDAYVGDCDCPLCLLKKNIEKTTVEYYLGASLMESDTRVLTNEKGFCRVHLEKMYKAEKNRLGMGLMLHTHLLDIIKDTEKDLRESVPENGSFFKGRDKDYKKKLLTLSDHLEARSLSCIVCDRIEYTMNRYLDVLFWMFFEQEGFRELFEKKKRYCLFHLAELLRGAAKYLNQNQAVEFLKTLSSLQLEGMNTMAEELEWFTLKFDYRNKDKPWGNSKDAVPRAISLLGGDPLEI